MFRKVILSGLGCLCIVVSACDRNARSNKTPAAASPAAEKTAGDTTPVTRVAGKDWCAEHGVPEAICTRCNAKLIPEFKKKGDWCKEHNLPESQCIKCDPKLEAKFKAMAPQEP